MIEERQPASVKTERNQLFLSFEFKMFMGLNGATVPIHEISFCYIFNTDNLRFSNKISIIIKDCLRTNCGELNGYSFFFFTNLHCI